MKNLEKKVQNLSMGQEILDLIEKARAAGIVKKTEFSVDHKGHQVKIIFNWPEKA